MRPEIVVRSPAIGLAGVTVSGRAFAVDGRASPVTDEPGCDEEGNVTTRETTTAPVANEAAETAVTAEDQGQSIRYTPR